MPNTWSWISKEQTNSFEITKQEIDLCKKNFAIVLSLSANIVVEKFFNCLDIGVLYRIKQKRVELIVLKV